MGVEHVPLFPRVSSKLVVRVKVCSNSMIFAENIP